jgi:hypothetical protein
VLNAYSLSILNWSTEKKEGFIAMNIINPIINATDT